MTKRYILHVLVAVNLALVSGLAWLWLTPQGSWRNVKWTPPAAKVADFTSGLPEKSEAAPIENSRLVAMLDRPLFSPTRRPPPPPPPPPVPPPVDTLASARLVAVYSGAEGGGAVVNLGGKSRKIRVNESIEGWVLKSIDGRSATFTSSDQTRALQLARSAMTTTSGSQPISAHSSMASPTDSTGVPPRPPGPPRGVFGGGSR